MSIPAFFARCLNKRLIAPGVYELRLQKPEGFTFLPGQFVLFDVPASGNPQDVQTRAYSIASAPSEEDLLFVIKLVPRGRASMWIEERVEPGMTISFKGPFGALLLDRKTDKPYLFIATGTGIAPFRSHILWSLEESHDTRPMHLIAGVVKRRDFFWEDQWKALEAEYPNLHAHASFLSGEPDWHVETGSVQERIRRIVKDPSNVSVYICGATEMVNNVQNLCHILGIPEQNIHTERYM
ncbi:hypothetical protein HYZ99_05225 [Candidatus Peregrinibacteria bacterium]|nr:hypothetical protein [Candidatus Peregrinibacteria bacterium]